MFVRYLCCIMILMSMGCAGGPKANYVRKYDPVMDKNGGVVLLMDVCRQVDSIGEGECFVIDESKKVASDLVDGIEHFLKQNGISVKTTLIPFACGSLETPENLPKKIVQKRGGKVKEAARPYGVPDRFSNDAEYLDALVNLSTYVSERGLALYLEDSAIAANKLDTFQKPALIVHENEFMKALDVIKEKTNASSVLYTGLRERKVSGGNKFAQGLVQFSVGMATAIATAGLGTGLAVYYIPGRDIDGKIFTTGLVDLESKKLTWKDWYTGEVSNPEQTKRLLKDLLFDDKGVEVDLTKFE